MCHRTNAFLVTPKSSSLCRVRQSSAKTFRDASCRSTSSLVEPIHCCSKVVADFRIHYCSGFNGELGVFQLLLTEKGLRREMNFVPTENGSMHQHLLTCGSRNYSRFRYDGFVTVFVAINPKAVDQKYAHMKVQK